MMQDRQDDDLLEDLFAEARAVPPKVPDDVMARIQADALAMQPAAAQPVWRTWLAALGGLPGLGGLVTATCVGFWLGVAPPATLPDLAGVVMGSEYAAEDDEIAPAQTGFGWDMEEG